MARGYLRILLLLSLVSIVTPSFSQGLNLTVENIRSEIGNIIVVVFDEEHAFENLQINSAIAFAELPAQSKPLAHTFQKLDAGPYAVFVFHDENSDKNLNFNDKRLLEGVGATGAYSLEFEPNFLQASVYPGSVNVRIFYED